MSINEQSSFNVVLEVVAKDGMQLEFASTDLKDNPEICSAAVGQNGEALKFCSERGRDDFEICIKALETRNFNNSVMGYSKAWPFVSERLRNDYDFILESVRFDNGIFDLYPSHLLCETFFMDQAVQRNGSIISFACLAIKQNRKIVLKAAKQNGHFLCFNDFAAYRSDREVALAACCSNTSTLKHISDEFKKETSFIVEVVRHGANYIDLMDNIDKDLLFTDEVLFNRDILYSICQNETSFVDYLLTALNHGKLDDQLLAELEEPCYKTETGRKKLDVVKLLFEKQKAKSKFS